MCGGQWGQGSKLEVDFDYYLFGFEIPLSYRGCNEDGFRFTRESYAKRKTCLLDTSIFN